MSFFENTRKPVGLGGKIMVAMMNFGHSAMAAWGLHFLQPAQDAMVLAGVSLLAFEVYAFYIKSVARSFYSQLLLLWIPMRTKFPLCFLSAFFLMLFLIPFI